MSDEERFSVRSRPVTPEEVQANRRADTQRAAERAELVRQRRLQQLENEQMGATTPTWKLIPNEKAFHDMHVALQVFTMALHKFQQYLEEHPDVRG